VKRERLYFSGTRRRATRYVGERIESEERPEGQPTVISRFAIIESDGQGQRYELNRPDSFWRSFSEVDLPDRRQGRNFVRRYGCPLGVLGTTSPEYPLSLWLPLQLPLRAAAQIWLPEDAALLSHCDTSRNELAARALVQDTPKEVWDETRLVPSDADPFEPEPRALTLRAFMVLSALFDLRNANTMRRCSNPFCRSWFTVRRTGALYCSQSCNVIGLKVLAGLKVLEARKGTASHGDDSQTQDQGRNHDLSSEVVRAEPGRETPAAHKKLRDRKGRKGVRRAADNRGRAQRRRRPAQA
jgi:hypothetical protein